MTSSRSEAERSLARVLLEEQPFEAARLMENEPAPASAELLAGESDDVVLPILRRLTPERAAEVVAALPGEARRRTLSSLNHDRAAVLLSKMDDGDRRRRLLQLPGHRDPADEQAVARADGGRTASAFRRSVSCDRIDSRR